MRVEDDVVDLLAASVAGDEAAFAALVDRMKGLVWSVIRAHGLGRTDAEDVFQVVFMRLYEHRARIADPTKLPGWLATTARRECYLASRSAARKLAHVPLDDVRLPGTDDDVDARLVRDERLRAYAEAFVALRDRCRQLLRLLSASPPLDYDDVAEIMGIPKGSIGPTRQRCLDDLRRHPAVRRISAAGE